jgi:superfamily II DNA/RNA helicase
MAQGSNIMSALLLGGMSYGPQLRDLRSRPRLVIGTRAV